MAVSFIVTSHNVAPYIARCLDSVAAVAQAGDQLVLVDDGSDDDTVRIVQDRLARGIVAPGVGVTPVFLGANTIGGVGIGANIGMDDADRDTIFFVDGDDWIDGDGFRRARAQWQAAGDDIALTNYLEFDMATQTARHPVDFDLWARLEPARDLTERRLQALPFIAVPWRKFYRRDFLRRHALRFPEGDFFFEDNPFHWQVCLAAERIGFIDVITSHHRVNRPQQTMASTGTELVAFFTHFDTILHMLPRRDRRFQRAAGEWLLTNMAWHVRRLARAAHYPYARAAAQALARIDDQIWAQIGTSFGTAPVWPVAQRLRQGDVWGQVDAWDRALLHDELAALRDRLTRLETDGGDTRDRVRALALTRSFEALQRAAPR